MGCFTDIGLYSQIHIHPFDERPCCRWRHLPPRGTSRLSYKIPFKNDIQCQWNRELIKIWLFAMLFIDSYTSVWWKAMLQVAPPSTKGYFSTIFIKYLSKMFFQCQWNRELIKMWLFAMCVMHSQLQFVTTHISVQVVRGSKRGAKKHLCGTFSKKYLMAATTLLSLYVFSRKNHNF